MSVLPPASSGASNEPIDDILSIPRLKSQVQRLTGSGDLLDNDKQS